MKRLSTLLPLLFLLHPFTCVYAEILDYERLYAPVLDSALDLILHGTEDHVPQNGETGIAEAIFTQNPSFTLEKIGYSILDLTGDSVPELVLGAIDGCSDDIMFGRTLCCLYLPKWNPTLLLDGWARNSYSFLRDGNLLNRASNGALYSIFGTYSLTSNGLECLDYFFTYEKDETYENVGIYLAAV